MNAVSHERVETLHERIRQLVHERQALREREAQGHEMERNRVEIARLQQNLSQALIARYRPATA